MVTYKREESENKYGGYRTRFQERLDNQDRFSKYATDSQTVVEDNGTFVEKELYEQLRRTENARQSAVSYAPEFNRQYAFNPVPSKKASKGIELTGMAKLLVVAYAVVTLLMVVLVIMNAVTIQANALEITEKENELAAVKEAYAVELNNASLLSDEEIMSLALKNGMVESTVAGTYQVIPERAPVSYEIETNWFDNLCDFIGSAFGG